MSLVPLVSGGLDSTLMMVLAHEARIPQFPLFVNYGQLCFDREWAACCAALERHQLPRPALMDLSGYGYLIPSGLTNRAWHINEDAFLPGRNALLILAGCAYAYRKNAGAVAIGLLSEDASLFPDQTAEFLQHMQGLINLAMGRDIRIVAPLMSFNKRAVLELARAKLLTETYSCHNGTSQPCGNCISCLERKQAEGEAGQ